MSYDFYGPNLDLPVAMQCTGPTPNDIHQRPRCNTLSKSEIHRHILRSLIEQGLLLPKILLRFTSSVFGGGHA
jgi:hypothetical protein